MPCCESVKLYRIIPCNPTGCLPVNQAHLVYRDLLHAQQNLILSTNLHLLFLVTPPDLTTTIQPNWMVYFDTVYSSHHLLIPLLIHLISFPCPNCLIPIP